MKYYLEYYNECTQRNDCQIYEAMGRQARVDNDKTRHSFRSFRSLAAWARQAFGTKPPYSPSSHARNILNAVDDAEKQFKNGEIINVSKIR